MIEGPFILATGFSFADIATIPWLLRMDVLEKSCVMQIPESHEFDKIRTWMQSCRQRRSVSLTTPRNIEIVT